MIVPTMTKAELLRELSNEMQYIGGMVEGINKKYVKQLRVPKSGILGITRYVSPRKNVIHCVWRKNWTGKFCSIGSTVFIEYTDADNHHNYIMPNFNHGGICVVSCTIFTGHSITRIKERAGLDFKQFLEYGETFRFFFSVESYEYKGKTVSATAFGDKGLLICEKGEWGTMIKTFVSTEMLGKNQEQHMDMVTQIADEYREETYKEVNDLHNSLIGVNRRERRFMAKHSVY